MRDGQGAALVHAVQGVDHQVQDHRFDFLAVNPGRHLVVLVEGQLLAFAVLQVLHHIEDTLDKPAEVGGLAAAFAAPAEFQEPLGDLLATESFLLDHFQVFADDLAVLVADGAARPGELIEQLDQSAFQGLAAKGNAGQGVVDLVGHAGGQETHSGQPFRAHQLAAALVNLPGQVAVHLAQPAGHIVEGIGQVLDLVSGFDVNRVVEIAMGHPPHSFLQIPDRVEHPAIKPAQQGQHQEDPGHGRGQNNGQRGLEIGTRGLDALVQIVVNHVVEIVGGGDQVVDCHFGGRAVLEQVQGRILGWAHARGHCAIDGIIQPEETLFQGFDLLELLKAVVRIAALFHRLGELLLVAFQGLAGFLDLVAQIGGLVLVLLDAALSQDFDGIADLVRLAQLFQPAGEGAHGGPVAGQALEGAGQQQGHDGYHQAEPEKQFVANAPVAGHAPTSLSAARRTAAAAPPMAPVRPLSAADSTRRCPANGEQIPSPPAFAPGRA